MATLVDRIREQIHTRYLRDNHSTARLPTERELVQGFGVSRGTVRSAIASLEAEGLIRRYPGKGTFLVRSGQGELSMFAPQETPRVGVVVRSMANRVTSEALASLMDKAWGGDINLMTQISRSDVLREIELLHRMVQSKAAAVIVQVANITSAGQTPALHRQIQQLKLDRSVPVVAIGLSDVYQHATQIWWDSVAAGELAVKHLIEQGHKRIGFIGQSLLPYGREALAGYRRAMEEAGLEVCEDHMLDLGTVPHSGETLQMGRNATKILLSGQRPPTAIFSYWSELAHGVFVEAQTRGMRMADDLAFVGMGYLNDSTAAKLPISVSSVEFDIHDQFTAALDVAMESSRGIKHPLRINLPFELRVRQSSGAMKS